MLDNSNENIQFSSISTIYVHRAAPATVAAVVFFSKPSRRGRGTIFFREIANLHKFEQIVSVYKCNTQNLGESHGFKRTRQG